MAEGVLNTCLFTLNGYKYKIQIPLFDIEFKNQIALAESYCSMLAVKLTRIKRQTERIKHIKGFNQLTMN